VVNAIVISREDDNYFVHHSVLVARGVKKSLMRGIKNIRQDTVLKTK